MISVNDLSVLLDNSYIIVDLKSKSKDGAINEMLNYAISNGLDINIENVISIINKKETIGNSGLGYGIAFPHIRTKDLEQNKIIFAISREGVDYGSRDNKPVHFIILFLTSLKPKKPVSEPKFMSFVFSSSSTRELVKSAFPLLSAYGLPFPTYTCLEPPSLSAVCSIGQ